MIINNTISTTIRETRTLMNNTVTLMNNIELTDNTIKYDGYTLYQIRAVNDIKYHNVVKGDLGGVNSIQNIKNKK